jgi:hypothetical protein
MKLALYFASIVSLIAFLPSTVSATDVTVDVDAVVRYVESCRKANGAFGPQDQEYTDAAWNYPAVRTLQLLGREVARPEAIVEQGLGTPAGHAGLGHYQFFHHHATRAALGRPLAPQHAKVDVRHQGFKLNYYSSPFGTENDLLYKQASGKSVEAVDAATSTFYYCNLSSLHYLLAALKASGREPAERQPLVDYVTRRFGTGGVVDVRSGDVFPSSTEIHLAHTWHGVACLDLLGAPIPSADGLAAFIRACRVKNGGYRYSTRAGGGNEPDVYYTWAALKTLKRLGVEPEKPEETRAYLNSLQNADGGFGDRPGWRSRLYSTFYAVEALSLLDGDARRGIATKQVPEPAVEPIAEGAFRIYQAQFKMPVVTVDELGGLHRRGFNLLALKSDKFVVVEPLLAAIREKELPMDVVLCPEEYPHRHTHVGSVTLNHVGNFTLDARWTAEQRAAWQAADAAGTEYLTWLGYRDRVVRPVVELGGLAYPEQDYDLEYAYMGYGADRSGAGGYNAVLAGFNWPPYDFVRVFPWRERYVDRLTTVADVDAHGDLTKWSDQLDYTRTLYIAKGPSYVDFQEAAAAGRVVTVIVGAEGVPSRTTYYGPQAAVDYVRRHVNDWKWWK